MPSPARPANSTLVSRLGQRYAFVVVVVIFMV